MAKIQLKSDNINPFGGLFSIHTRPLFRIPSLTADFQRFC